MNNVELFQKQKYVELKKVLSPEMIHLISTYAKLDETNDFSIEEGPKPQIRNSHSQYADTLMESILLHLHPTMEENTGLKLYPAYSYYRVYRPGADLVKHVDRPSCEVSTTVTLEFDYNGETITGSNGLVQRIEKPEIIAPTEMDILHVFNTNSNSTVVVPEDVVEGSSLNFVNIGEHDIYVNNPDGDTANGENITVLKPNERVELFRVNGVWIDPRGDNLYLD